MISRRQIIENQQELSASRLQDGRGQLAPNSATNRQVTARAIKEDANKRKSASTSKQQQQQQKPTPTSNRQSIKTFEHETTREDYELNLTEEMTNLGDLKCFQDHEQYDRTGRIRQHDELQLQDSADEREDECKMMMMMMQRNNINMSDSSNNSNGNNLHHEDYRHFDPYSVYGEEDEEEDVWYSEERLFEDHIQEIIDKWLAIDDEIWAKIICMERNRRIAKAYARKHSLTVNGSEDEYLDGTTLGLNSFDNPDRDTKTRHIKQYIGQGVRIKITQNGDILVKRLSKANVFVHRQHHYSGYSDRLRSSNSSSDLYALNSEAGDLYGIVSPLHRSLNNGLFSSPQYPFSGFQNSAHRTAPKVNGSGKVNQERHKFAAAAVTSSDASTSSSNGFCTGKKSANSKQTVQSSNSNNNNNNRVPDSKRKPLRYGDQLGSDQLAAYSSVVLEHNRPMKIFDMARFKSMLERESRRPCPNRRLLQSQCISIISFVVDDHKMLNLPSWIMVFNIVAIDLLKIELGLLDSNELFAGCGGPPASLPDPLANRRRFGYHLTDHRHTEDSEFSSPPNSMATSNRVSRNGQHQDLERANQLAASKKAFANAAALGAYNGDHCNNQADYQSRQQLSGVGKLQKYISKFEKVACREVENEEEATKMSRKRQGEHLLLADNDTITGDVQQSSSSSGFNSHCSSQNDSSAASSSSNIAGSAAGAQDEHLETGKVGAASDQQAGNKGLIYKQLGVAGAELTGVAQSRGKRPPKLPHRLAAPGAGRPTMSQPVPIPAPPTSAGGGPSGKANLILVSPTGLSPPLAKRKSQLVGGGALNAVQANQLKRQTNQQTEVPPVPEFSTIKHIDENGRCSVLMEASQPKLPAGIPAHAQLAPPATQRHILRYLMSATRGKLAELGSGSPQHHYPQRFVPPLRYQRPLPIVPPSRKGAGQDEEGLYYCGLQARVSSNRPRAPPGERHLNQPNSNSAINAILTDFRRNSHQQANQLAAPYLRPHISLTNLEDALKAAQVRSYRQQQQHLQCNSNKAHLSSQKPSGAQSIARPLLKFFRPSLGASSAGKSASSNVDSIQDNPDGSMFLSVDNLNQSGQKLNSALKGLPLKLKKAKGKKLAKDS